MRLRLVSSVTVTIVLILVVAGCSSSSKKSSTTSTTTSGKNFQVQTPDGQVSLSLNGQLPPNWPTTFPVPPGATPAGSGSLVNGGTDVMVGVYSTSQSPSAAYNFYKTNSSLTVASSKSAGAGNSYVGTVKLGGTYNGSSVVVVSHDNNTYIVVTLKLGEGTTTTTSVGASTTTT